MRRSVVLVLAALACVGARAEGGFCTIPELVRGHPTEVPVDDITKGFCGAARVNRKVVRLDQVAVRKYDGPVVCSAHGRDCWQRVEYYLAEDDWSPYVVILRGPKGAAEG